MWRCPLESQRVGAGRELVAKANTSPRYIPASMTNQQQGVARKTPSPWTAGFKWSTAPVPICSPFTNPEFGIKVSFCQEWAMITPAMRTSQRKNPICGIAVEQQCRSNGSTAGKTTRRVPPKEAWQPYVSAVLTQNRHQRLDPPSA